MRSDCKRAGQRTATREKVLAAARAVFAGGYEQATMRAIANAAGLSTGSIFNCFKDKADLYRAVYGHAPISPDVGRALFLAANVCLGDGAYRPEQLAAAVAMVAEA